MYKRNKIFEIHSWFKAKFKSPVIYIKIEIIINKVFLIFKTRVACRRKEQTFVVTINQQKL